MMAGVAAAASSGVARRAGASEEGSMATYISLVNWTDQGIKAYRDTTARADASKALAAKYGGRMVSIWWTIGPYDLVAVSEFSDDESATAFALELGAAGNIRTTTMRAFGQDEMSAIIARTG
jgi:uncharacterized protein with GYD domain